MKRRLKGYWQLAKISKPCGVKMTNANIAYYDKHRDDYVWSEDIETIIDLKQDKHYECIVWGAVHKDAYISVFQIVEKVELPF